MIKIMKNLKSYLAAFAFFIAFGAAFASTTLNINSLSKLTIATGACTTVTTSVNCNTTSANDCKDATFQYYSDNSCVTILKKQ